MYLGTSFYVTFLWGITMPFERSKEKLQQTILYGQQGHDIP